VGLNEEEPEARDRGNPWMTVICYEGRTEALLWETEADARAYFRPASAQWSDAFLTEVHICPRDVQAYTFGASEWAEVAELASLMLDPGSI
jgi:hypothetical protein